MPNECERCQQPAERRYTFFYGTTEEVAVQYFNEIRRTTTYTVAGSLTLPMCNSCVRRYYIIKIFRSIGQSLIAAACGSLLWLFAPMNAGANLTFLEVIARIASWGGFLMCAAAALVAIITALVALNDGPNRRGMSAAFNLRRKDLQESGYDKYWGPNELDDIRKEQN